MCRTHTQYDAIVYIMHAQILLLANVPTHVVPPQIAHNNTDRETQKRHRSAKRIITNRTAVHHTQLTYAYVIHELK